MRGTCGREEEETQQPLGGAQPLVRPTREHSERQGHDYPGLKLEAD